jgi:glycosyltransferase domain-containing protein
MEKQLSIILFSHRRPDFLLRFLKCYNRLNFKYNLIIGYGGKDILSKAIHDEIKKNKKIVYKKFNNEFNFKKNEYDINKFFIRRLKCLRMVKTKYVKFICDDDFIIDYTTKKCVKFLNKNKNYIAAGGSFINYELHKKYYGRFINLSHGYIIKSNTSNDKFKRIKQYYENAGDTFNCVFRTNDLIKIHLISSKFNCQDDYLKYHHFENVVHLYGKIKYFKQPIIFHENHNDWHEGSGTEWVEKIKSNYFIKHLESLSVNINNNFKLKNPKLIENLYFKKFIIKDLAKINYKNYHSIKDIFKYIKILFVTKIKYYKKLFFLKNIDTQKFIAKTFNSQIVNESLKYEIFLKNNDKK